jgi:hypothetical protein
MQYTLRATVDISPEEDQTIRDAHQLAPDEPLIHTVRTEAWEALTAAGSEAGFWGRVTVT